MNGDDRSQLEIFRAEVNGKLDLLIERDTRLRFDFEAHKNSTNPGSHQDHETRIRSVERWKLSIPISALLAIATVVGAAVSR